MSTVIAVNTRILEHGKLEGIGNFTAEVFKRITQQHPEIQFHFIFNYPYHKDFIFGDNITPHIIQPPAKHPILVRIWYEFSLKRLLNKIKPDLFISPDAITSLSTKTPCLTVMHDINFAHRPLDLPKAWSKFYNKYSKKFAEKSIRIATVSEYSKNDIAATYNIPTSKIDVVYNGIKSVFNTNSQNPRDKPYFFYIGSLHPRKNIANLILAFNEFKQKQPSDVQLILGGNYLFNDQSIEDALNKIKFKDEVVFTGRLSDEDLNNYLNHALALTYVPFFEGFGIPVVEAMQCETPVITSNTTSLPEICGDAAILVNPNEIPEISDAMRQIYQNEPQRFNLIEKGKVQCQKFSWDKTANLMWDCIQKCLKK